MNKKYKPVDLFLTINLLGLLLFAIIAPFIGQRIVDWIVMENNPDYGSLDYFKLIPYSQHLSDIYFFGDDQFYPPLEYIPFYYILKVTTYGSISDNIRDIPQEPYQIWFYLMYNILGAIWFVYLISEFKLSKIKKFLLTVSVICSVPMFAGAIERGNPAFYVMLLMLNSVLWKDSLNPLKRECALIMISIAAGMKIYPAVFGLLYVKEKRWRECGRLIIYGTIAFFVPFIWFGGVDGLIKYMGSLRELSTRDMGTRCEFFLGLMSFARIDKGVASMLNILFIILLMVGILITKSKFNSLIYFASLMAFVPNNAFRYTLIYFIISFFYLFDNTREVKKMDYLFALILGNIFTIPTWLGIMNNFKLNMGIYSYTYVERYIYTFAWILLAVVIINDVYVYGKAMKEKWRQA